MSCLDSSDTYGNTSNAFIFSLNNEEELAPFKTNARDPSKAIYRFQRYGPRFGYGDIMISNYANRFSFSRTMFGLHYFVPREVQHQSTILAGTYRFSPDEVEVFYLDLSH